MAAEMPGAAEAAVAAPQATGALEASLAQRRPAPRLEGWHRRAADFGSGGRRLLAAASEPALLESGGGVGDRPGSSMRSEAARRGWVEMQVSWLRPREQDPLGRARDVSFPANRRYSASTLRLYADREASMKRNLLTEVCHRNMDLEQVMRARMGIYEATPVHEANRRVDGEAPFPDPASAAAAARAVARGSLASNGRPFGSDALHSCFLRPRSEVLSAAEGAVKKRAATDADGVWTASSSPPSPDDPVEEDGSPWHSLLRGVRPWSTDRDGEMREVLIPGKMGIKRTIDASSYGGIACLNCDKNYFYMSLHDETKPAVRLF